MGEAGSSDVMVPLVENEDYYLDQGLMVFTGRYHLRRGYCCDQGCRHCPYAEALEGDAKVDVDYNEATN